MHILLHSDHLCRIDHNRIERILFYVSLIPSSFCILPVIKREERLRDYILNSTITHMLEWLLFLRTKVRDPFSIEPHYIIVYKLYLCSFLLLSNNFFASWSVLELIMRTWPTLRIDSDPNLYLMFEFGLVTD